MIDHPDLMNKSTMKTKWTRFIPSFLQDRLKTRKKSQASEEARSLDVINDEISNGPSSDKPGNKRCPTCKVREVDYAKPKSTVKSIERCTAPKGRETESVKRCLKPKEQANKPKEQANKPKEQANKPKEQANKPKEQANKPKEQANQPKEQANQPFELLLRVDPVHFGRIIGKGGKVIKSLQTRHNVNIQVPKRTTNDTVTCNQMTIKGSPKNTERAKEEILHLVNEINIKYKCNERNN